MNLKNHILISLIAILLLFLLNYSINFWSSELKDVAIKVLQRETEIQSISTSIKQGIGEIQLQLSSLGQIHVDGASSALSAAEIKRIDLKSGEIVSQISKLLLLSDGELKFTAGALRLSYSELANSWHFFLANFGVNQVQAMTEFALHIEPLGNQVLYTSLPLLEELERKQIESANLELSEASWWADRTSLITFITSFIASIGIAILLSRRVFKGVHAIKMGVESFSNGDDIQRIGMKSKHEFGEIANAIDKLSDDLVASRNQRTDLEKALTQRNLDLDDQSRISESYLRNILPSTVAEEFIKNGTVEPRYLEDVTIIFTDFVGFSSSAEKLAADELVQLLHEYFTAFDEISSRYGLEKLKTIGDSYMCAGGLPERNPSHPVDAVMAAMEIVQFVTEHGGIDSQHKWSIRIGIHTGHLIAGMVGKQKFTYDIWGESVNYASRVESTSEPNCIALSAQTHMRVKDFFECELHNKTHAKISHEMELYFVKGFLESLTDDTKQLPPAAFLRRYHSYFQKDPPSYPKLNNMTQIAQA